MKCILNVQYINIIRFRREDFFLIYFLVYCLIESVGPPSTYSGRDVVQVLQLCVNMTWERHCNYSGRDVV